MQLAEFLHGLRQRNWTSPYHKPDAEPWQVLLCHTMVSAAAGSGQGRSAAMYSLQGLAWICFQHPGCGMVSWVLEGNPRLSLQNVDSSTVPCLVILFCQGVFATLGSDVKCKQSGAGTR